MSVKTSDVCAFTKRKLEFLLKTSSESGRKAALANLRLGVGHKPGELPELWGEFLSQMPEEMYGFSGPSQAENAVYTALTLFALHQQGHELPDDPMYCEDVKLGTAAARLIIGETDAESAFERIRRKFNMVATASDTDELTHHLRGLVQLMRAKGIPLDYAGLAGDIFLYQNADLRSGIRLRWGQDFYREYEKLTYKGKDENNDKSESFLH